MVDFTIRVGCQPFPDSALVSSSEAERVDVARVFPPAGGRHRRVRRRPRPLQDRGPLHLRTTGPDVLRCGEALSAVLLECTVAGMATCTLTHMTEMAASRKIIAQIAGTTGQPQVLIRVGRSPATTNTSTPPLGVR